MNRLTARFLTLLTLTALLAAACGSTASSTDTASDAEADPSTETASSQAPLTAGPGVRLVTATEGAAIADNPPEDLVILDVRTLEEFVEGHLEGATMLDFYESDFGEQLLELDRDVPYLLYCRSGNRSGQTAAMMQQLGFNDVADVDGGILSWTETGLPTVTK